MAALVIAGSALYLLMGVGHAVLIAVSGRTGGPLAPTDGDVRRAMFVPTGLGMAPRLDSTLWKAWLGFNLSHALGVVAVAGTILFHAVTDLEAVADEPWFLGLACVLPVLYLALSLRYWFARPTRGIAMGAVLLIVGTLGVAFG